jgi:hypothetical protein
MTSLAVSCPACVLVGKANKVACLGKMTVARLPLVITATVEVNSDPAGSIGRLAEANCRNEGSSALAMEERP